VSDLIAADDGGPPPDLIRLATEFLEGAESVRWPADHGPWQPDDWASHPDCQRPSPSTRTWQESAPAGFVSASSPVIDWRDGELAPFDARHQDLRAPVVERATRHLRVEADVVAHESCPALWVGLLRACRGRASRWAHDFLTGTTASRPKATSSDRPRATEDECTVFADGGPRVVSYALPPRPRARRVAPGDLMVIAGESGAFEVILWRWFDAVVVDQAGLVSRSGEPNHGTVVAQARDRRQGHRPGSRANLSAGLPGAEWWVAGSAGRPCRECSRRTRRGPRLLHQARSVCSPLPDVRQATK